MSIFRSGLLLVTLFLSACSMPIFSPQPDATDQVKDSATDLITPNQQVVIEEPAKATGYAEDLADLNKYQQSAEKHYQALNTRLGSANKPPRIIEADLLSREALQASIQQLRTYISQTNTELAALDARVGERQQMPISGDLVRLFLSETTVNEAVGSFKAQPLIGQWVRGESRVIRLKDNFLFESPNSEDVTITFSERYQILINGQVVMTVSPQRAKNSAKFQVPTQDQGGSLIGKLDYRLVNN
ncbi:hypothetical protein [Marinomonas aquiplantarum]|uniref:LPP20 lipoprotein n=1 Tax=Marinomonas aquiplantarum TaxID=491951 RepID=A0A366D1P7_9GAMM|nr:hypothetical protein [Marinomonas aquiplantarum]RBO83993.1 hypothetical protein DFP76_103267 [Marinomonas aquiplantarum]